MSDYSQQNGLTAEQRDQLILDHLPLLHHIVGRMALELPARLDREDLLGYGMLGLVSSSDAWDPERGLKFSTYAYPRIRGSIIDELRRGDFLSRTKREHVRDLERAWSELEQELGAPPSIESLAQALAISEEDVLERLTTARSAMVISLDDGPGEEFGALLSDPRSANPAEDVEQDELKGLLRQAIVDLPEQEQAVITLYYAEELLLREIGEVLGVTESRVSQIHTSALYRLNRALQVALGATQ